MYFPTKVSQKTDTTVLVVYVLLLCATRVDVSPLLLLIAPFQSGSQLILLVMPSVMLSAAMPTARLETRLSISGTYLKSNMWLIL